jgi:hypothetical protein
MATLRQQLSGHLADLIDLSGRDEELFELSVDHDSGVFDPCAADPFTLARMPDEAKMFQ